MSLNQNKLIDYKFIMGKIDMTVKYSLYQKLLKSNNPDKYKSNYKWLFEPKKRWEINNRVPKQHFMKVD